MAACARQARRSQRRARMQTCVSLSVLRFAAGFSLSEPVMGGGWLSAEVGFISACMGLYSRARWLFAEPVLLPPISTIGCFIVSCDCSLLGYRVRVQLLIVPSPICSQHTLRKIHNAVEATIRRKMHLQSRPAPYAVFSAAFDSDRSGRISRVESFCLSSLSCATCLSVHRSGIASCRWRLVRGLAQHVGVWWSYQEP